MAKTGALVVDGIRAIVFDLYGTLFDVHTVARECEAAFPSKGRALSEVWRQKQLEYTWLRALMARYEDFERVTADALRHSCNSLGLKLPDALAETLTAAYLKLDPYPEVPATLARLKALGLPLAILSNGSPRSIATVVGNADLGAAFTALISADERRTYKPQPSIYQLAVDQLGAAKQQILFVSSNSWDAAGAASFGFRVAWLNRGNRAFDELGVRPDAIIGGLDGLLVAAV